MSEESALFGDDNAVERRVPGTLPIAAWQVDLVRKSLDARGLSSMDERQKAVQDAVGRPVESLRSLTHDEGIQVLSHLARQRAARADGSAWDVRDEDTWIDRL